MHKNKCNSSWIIIKEMRKKKRNVS